jgi:hypothetical protein
MVKNLWRTTWAIFAAIALIAGSGAPSAFAGGQTIDQFYGSTKVYDVYLNIPKDSLTSLDTNLKAYTAAQIEFITADQQSSGPINIGLRLKGSTSLEKISGHPSFKIKFNWSSLKGQRFVGLKRMTLNAMTQDNSMIHEAAAYRLYNQMGVPAPRTGYARVFINGVFKSLYVSIETPDDIFLGTKFADPTKHLYEGIALKDFVTGNDNGDAVTGAFLVDQGWSTTPNKNDITKAIQVTSLPTGANWWAQMNGTFDRKKLVMLFAVDNFIGNWDSYSGPIVNNYFVRSNIDGKFTMMPWGTDQTFGENRATPAAGDDYFFPMDTPNASFPWMSDPQFHGATSLPRGILFQKCLAYKICKTEYLNDLKAVMTQATKTGSSLTNYMRAQANLVRGYSSSANILEQTRTINWVGKQITKVKALLKKNGIKY